MEVIVSWLVVPEVVLDKIVNSSPCCPSIPAHTSRPTMDLANAETEWHPDRQSIPFLFRKTGKDWERKRGGEVCFSLSVLRGVLCVCERGREREREVGKLCKLFWGMLQIIYSAVAGRTSCCHRGTILLAKSVCLCVSSHWLNHRGTLYYPCSRSLTLYPSLSPSLFPSLAFLSVFLIFPYKLNDCDCMFFYRCIYLDITE